MDRVLEIGGFAAGYCGRLFVHQGADVVRVSSNQQSPSWVSQEAMDLYLHAGKRRINSADRSLIADLAAHADIVICEASQADELLRLGIDDWPTHTKVVITPYGRTGPKRNWRATPNVMLAVGGYTQLIGDPDKEPLTIPGHYVEFQAGALAFTAANASRLAGGESMQASIATDISMFETLMSLSQFTTVRWHCCGELRQRHGSDFWYVVPSNLFACTDGWVYINIVPSFWDPLTVFLDKPELLIDDRFITNGLRMLNRAELHEIVSQAVAQWTKDELVARAETCRVPLGVVLNFAEVLDDPHLQARGYWSEFDGQEHGKIKLPGPPYRINGGAKTPSAGQQDVASAW